MKFEANGFISVPFNLLLSWVSSAGDEKRFISKREYAVDFTVADGNSQPSLWQPPPQKKPGSLRTE